MLVGFRVFLRILFSFFLLASSESFASSALLRRSSNVPHYSKVFDMVLRMSTPQGELNKAEWRRQLYSHPDRGGVAQDAAIVNAAKDIIDKSQSATIKDMRSRGGGMNDEEKAIMTENVINRPVYSMRSQAPRVWTPEELAMFKAKMAFAGRKLTNMENVIHSMLDVSGYIFKHRMADIGTETSVSSGDRRYHNDNFWVKGFVGKSSCKSSSSGASNVSGNHSGFSLGWDVKTQANNIIGLAYTRSYAEAKVKETSGDSSKTSANMHMFSLYGRAELGHEIFGDCYGAYGYGKLSCVGEDSKNSVAVIKGAVDLGYRWDLNDEFTIFPKIGVSYDSITMPISVQNKSEMQKLAGVWGNFSTSARYKQNVSWGSIVYDIHAGISNVIRRKTNMKSIDSSWVDSSIKDRKYNIGTHVSIFRVPSVVSIGCDMSIAQKSKSRGHEFWGKLEIKL
ncbi:MAG: autotransporter outer membrane beta-barrel domain-containing protein [Rickettsiaceae bacterium]|nr:autotransporter outer membrane beta-barrel domain-containing protein [Rickettsiaceae bacterium]